MTDPRLSPLDPQFDPGPDEVPPTPQEIDEIRAELLKVDLTDRKVEYWLANEGRDGAAQWYRRMRRFGHAIDNRSAREAMLQAERMHNEAVDQAGGNADQMARDVVSRDTSEHGSGGRVSKGLEIVPMMPGMRMGRWLMLGAAWVGLVLVFAAAGYFVEHPVPGYHEVGKAVPVSQAKARSAPAVAKPYGLMLTGAVASLKFDNYVGGACPPGDVKYMGKAFSGDWKMAASSAASPSDLSINMLSLDPFGAALNGFLGPSGLLDVKGDSNVEMLHLSLTLPQDFANPTAAVSVTGTADVALHFVGSANIGTTTGDCNAKYGVAGTVTPNGSSTGTGPAAPPPPKVTLAGMVSGNALSMPSGPIGGGPLGWAAMAVLGVGAAAVALTAAARRAPAGDDDGQPEQGDDDDSQYPEPDDTPRQMPDDWSNRFDPDMVPPPDPGFDPVPPPTDPEPEAPDRVEIG